MKTHRTEIGRRGFLRISALGLGAAAVATPLLAACGSGGDSAGGVSTSGLAGVLPDHVPFLKGVHPDIPSVTGANGASTEPGYLTYPTNLVTTVDKTPGAGGSYSAITPLWGAIPPAGNAYYQAVNKALGATIDIHPANGNTYATTVPTLVAGGELPDWIQLPSQWNTNFNVGALAATKFADLTPYLSGSNIRQYPNLAAITTGGWQSGAWEGKLYGLPSFTQGDAFQSALFYRKDVFDSRGINPDDIRSADDLYHLGAELSAPTANVWAFDVLWDMIQQMFGAPSGFYVDKGKLVHAFESPRMEAALEFAYKLAKSGYVHPNALANDTSNKTQRFYSGNELVAADGPGGWNVSDARQGQAANPRYERGAFKLFASDGSTPTISLGPSTGIVSYLNKRLSPTQIKECLRIANYLAAPFGSTEYQLINFGVEGTHWTKSADGPAYTDLGQRDCSQPTYQFLAAPDSHVNSPGYQSVTRGYCAWVANAVKYAYKPVFWNVNVTLPSRFASVSTAQQVNDTITQVTCGTKTVADYKNVVKNWKSSGGDTMVDWYQKNVLDKYGTGH